MLCCTACELKLPLDIIFKRRVLPAKEVFAKKVIMRVDENGWMSGALAKDRFNTMWQRHAGALLRESLLVNNCRKKITDAVKPRLSQVGTGIAIIQGGLIN